MTGSSAIKITIQCKILISISAHFSYKPDFIHLTNLMRVIEMSLTFDFSPNLCYNKQKGGEKSNAKIPI